MSNLLSQGVRQPQHQSLLNARSHPQTRDFAAAAARSRRPAVTGAPAAAAAASGPPPAGGPPVDQARGPLPVASHGR